MTGNVVFLGIGATRAGGPGFVRAAVALAAFAVGAYLAVRITKPTKGSGVWPRRVSVTLGVSVLAQVVFLGGWMATSGRPPEGVGAVEALVALSALAMGLQSGAVMSLGVAGVFTTAATATLLYLVSDILGWSQSATERHRVAGVLAGLFAGAAAGGVLLVHARPFAPLLPLIGTVLVISIASAVLRPTQPTTG
jgi:uncharacterized membrane protein YoaK (UPF0700 family)